MRRVLIIFKWMLAISLLVVLLTFTNESQAVQEISLNKIEIQESPDDFVNTQIVLNYLKNKSLRFDSMLATDFNKEILEDLLASHPAIREVEVFTNQKGEMNIIIEQKKAIVSPINAYIAHPWKPQCK